jgi:hypothetical protein
MKSAEKMAKKHKGSLGGILHMGAQGVGAIQKRRRRDHNNSEVPDDEKKENASEQTMKRSGLPLEIDTASNLSSSEGYKNGHIRDDWFEEQKFIVLKWANSVAREIVEKRLNERKKMA